MLGGFPWLLPWGWVGVLVFYVLSGFLITRILLAERAQAQTGLQYFGRFHFRRMLRIFPLYFAYLFALDLVYLGYGVHSTWPEVRPWAFGYAVNVGMVQGEVNARAAYGHLWTLAVEEQFYLVWPLVVWFVSRVWLGRLAIALVLAGPLVRFASVQWFGLNIHQLYVSSFTHMDAFAAGALLAVYDFRAVRRIRPYAVAAIATTLALGLAVIWTTGRAVRTLGYAEGLHDGNAHLWGYTVLNLTAAVMVLAALRGELRWFGHPVLAYIGKISYGIYLFQRPVIGLYLELIEPWVQARIAWHSVALAIGVVTCAGVVTAMAAASYHLFEAPLLRWRDRKVPARPGRARGQASASSTAPAALPIAVEDQREPRGLPAVQP